MPSLKTDRGTVLYARITYDGPAGSGQQNVASVLNLGIAAIKRDEFLMDGGGPAPFGAFIPEMAGATATACLLSISYPDGTFTQTGAIAFGQTVLVGWSDALLHAYGPPIDPDWKKNPPYITVDQHRTIHFHHAL